MELIKRTPQTSDSIRILLIGNNPLELSSMLETIAKVPGRKILTETAFDLKSIVSRLLKFSPDFILIDDNIGRDELSQTINSLAHNSKTKNVPITVLKNTNYEQSIISPEIFDFLLKRNVTVEAVYSLIKNTLKFRRTRQYLIDVYNRRKSMLLKLAH